MTPEKLESPLRRGLLAGSIAALLARVTTADATFAAEPARQAAAKDAIRPFRVSFPQAALTGLI